MNDLKLELLLDICNGFVEKTIRSRSREQEYVNARYIFCQIAKNIFDIGVSEIGRFLKFNHATILNYVVKFNGVYRTDEVIRDLYKKALKEIIEAQPTLLNYKFTSIDNRIDYHKKSIEELIKKREDLMSNV